MVGFCFLTIETRTTPTHIFPSSCLWLQTGEPSRCKMLGSSNQPAHERRGWRCKEFPLKGLSPLPRALVVYPTYTYNGAPGVIVCRETGSRKWKRRELTRIIQILLNHSLIGKPVFNHQKAPLPLLIPPAEPACPCLLLKGLINIL